MERQEICQRCGAPAGNAWCEALHGGGVESVGPSDVALALSICAKIRADVSQNGGYVDARVIDVRPDLTSDEVDFLFGPDA